MKNKLILLLLSFIALSGCTIKVTNPPEVPVDVIYNQYNITNTITDNYSNNIKSVVTIVESFTYEGSSYQNMNTGMIYKKTNSTYYVLTTLIDYNYLSNSKFELFTYDLKKFDLTIHAGYVGYNIAIFKFTSTENLDVIEIGDIDEVKVNDYVYSIGTVFDLNLSNSLQVGNVSGINRMAGFSIDEQTSYSIYAIQTTLLYSYGVFGSPVFNLDGKVIGMLSITYNSETIEGTTFFIPLSKYSHVIDTLISTTQYSRGLLGISGRAQMNVTNDYQTNKGYYAEEVAGGAKNAGIKVGSLITHINDVEIVTLVDLVKELLKFKPGQSVKVKYLETSTSSPKEVNVILQSE